MLYEFHDRRDRGVSAMLFRLYRPIIFRFLTCPNWEVQMVRTGWTSSKDRTMRQSV